ncbi:PREDICTED: uncharacterized protein LOC101310244 [Fragaria vesca subsp. vesca]|uniref:uncharacterized protein LOC101310244 n=1 Tax=Fragaria vesca subsp. vesca TaxID=101020 RepID=UPI0002C2EFB9|nr:PREDICTED: uncharacterized protein LOC101310244 [Fragaria vesca subsp. vesca]
MDCNKEDAIKAMQLAERKMQGNDFTGARKMAQKAQRLFPGLGNITQLLAVCDVHCSAENKLGGCEMDWYGILQVQRFSTEAIINEKFKKLMPLLHPDTNKFAGAEAAFNLIKEANAVLADPGKQSVYDTKCRYLLGTGVMQSSAHQFGENLFLRKHCDAARNAQNIPQSQYASMNAHQKGQADTFSSCCPFCNTVFVCAKDSSGRVSQCQRCRKFFIASLVELPSKKTKRSADASGQVEEGEGKEDKQVEGVNASKKKKHKRTKTTEPITHSVDGQDSTLPDASHAVELSSQPRCTIQQLADEFKVDAGLLKEVAKITCNSTQYEQLELSPGCSPAAFNQSIFTSLVQLAHKIYVAKEFDEEAKLKEQLQIAKEKVTELQSEVKSVKAKLEKDKSALEIERAGRTQEVTELRKSLEVEGEKAKVELEALRKQLGDARALAQQEKERADKAEADRATLESPGCCRKAVQEAIQEYKEKIDAGERPTGPMTDLLDDFIDYSCEKACTILELAGSLI